MAEQAQAQAKVTIGDEEYVFDVDGLTLGEGLALKRRFGVDDLSKLDDLQDPAVLIGWVYIAVRRSRPEWSDERVVQYVENARFAEVDLVEEGKDEDPEPSDPTKPAAGEQNGDGGEQTLPG